ncbi:MAG: hypothetical protein QOJ59_1040 [Thermomicrobiales bacterium]|jgi:glycosyltransferase involved in cell wall biosynthesis|nr:hypothetical protein [Thermomicrobiales bacterium]
MKLVSVLHFPEFGGPHNQALRLSPALAHHGVESTIVLPAGPGADRLRASGLDVRIVPLGRVRAVPNPRTQLQTLGRFPLDMRALISLYRRERPDVVQLNGLMNPHAALAARALGISVVWQLLDTRPPMRLRRVMMPLVRRLADVVMPIGHGVARAHPGTEAFGERMVVFYAPVDTALFRPGTPSTLRAELGIAPDAPVVGVVGNVNPQKGHEHFATAAALVHQSFPEARFVIAGQIYANHPTHSEYHRRLVAQAESGGLRVGQDLVFLGARRDIPNVMAAFDILALASVPNSEGTPTVILEAMATGLPVVATAVGSVAEVVADGETGFVVPAEQPQIMADRLTTLLSDRERRTQMGTKGRERTEREFNLDRCVADHLRAYNLAIEHRRHGKHRATTHG